MSTIKLYKPTSASRRKTSVIDYSKVLTSTSQKPYKKLTTVKKEKAGRNNHGKITVRHRGSGNKRLLRTVDFKRNFENGYKVLTVEYAPGRTGFVSLVVDLKTGNKHYILHSAGLQEGQVYDNNQDINDGNTLPLKSMPVGSFVSQVEIRPGQGGIVVRSAGSYAIVTAKDDKYVTLKLPSNEIRKFNENCKCVVGRVGNEAHGLVRVGKAGRKRKMGWRPTVRGKVMNPVDHPHGGGEARNSIGMAYPKTPWGKHALGVRTRDKKKPSSVSIVKRRAQKRK
jgi:large subunit ribosomal protein L2